LTKCAIGCSRIVVIFVRLSSVVVSVIISLAVGHPHRREDVGWRGQAGPAMVPKESEGLWE